MPFSFMSTDELRAKVAGFLKQPNPANLVSSWDSPIKDALDAAYRDIEGTLSERGYTVAQIRAWDDGKAVQGLIGLYYALVFGAGLHSTEPWAIRELDQRSTLKTAPVGAADSDPIGPQGSPGIIQVGVFATDNDRWNDKTQW